MNAYLLTIIGTVLLSAIVTTLIPEGKTANTVKGVAKLACLLVIVSPVLGFLKGKENIKNPQTIFGETVIETDASFIKYYSEMRIRNAQVGLQEELAEKFSVETEVTLLWIYEGEENIYDTDKIRITKIRVRAETDIDEETEVRMREYLTQKYCSEVQIE